MQRETIGTTNQSSEGRSGSEGLPGSERGVTRRQAIQGGAAGALGVAAAGALAACGSGSGKSTTTAAADVKTSARGGTVRIGLTGGGAIENPNPVQTVLSADILRQKNIWDPLATIDANGQPQLYLAEEVTPNADATEWTIRVPKGVTFHGSGKELTADDVKFSFATFIQNYGGSRNLLAPVDWKNIRKRDKYTVTVPCTTPFATFLQSLSCAVVFMLPTTFDVKKASKYDPKNPPDGTGPYRLTSFTPGQRVVLERNPDYWKEGLPYADRVEITDFADLTSQVNAMMSGQVDAINGVTKDVVDQLKSAGKKVTISQGGGMTPLVMRTDAAPFDDVRVRQAMRLLADREQQNQVLFGGEALLGNDIIGPWAAEFDKSIPQRQQDVEQAKSLLKAAGREGLNIELITSEIDPGSVKAATLYAQQAAAGGVKVKVRQVPVGTLYGPQFLKWNFSQDYWTHLHYFPQVSWVMLPTSSVNETHFSDAKYAKLFAEGQRTLDDKKRTEIAHEMQQIEYDKGGYIIAYHPAVIDVFDEKVQGEDTGPSKTGSSFNNQSVKQMVVAS